jgi:ribosomal-protein-serine acetyltransferase
MHFEHRVDDHLALRLLTAQDAPRLAELVRENVARLEPWLPFAHAAYDEDAARTFIQASARQWAEGRGFQTGMLLDGRLVGMVGIHDVVWSERRFSIGYWVGQEAEGIGLVTRAVSAILDWAFGETAMERAEILAGVDNRRSRAVAERLGFRPEGTLRRARRGGYGFLDMAVYGLLREEWPRSEARPAEN